MKFNLLCFVSDVESYVQHKTKVSNALDLVGCSNGFRTVVVGRLPKVSLEVVGGHFGFRVETEDRQYLPVSTVVCKEFPKCGVVILANSAEVLGEFEESLVVSYLGGLSVTEVGDCEEWI